MKKLNDMKRAWMFILVAAFAAVAISCEELAETPQFNKSDAEFTATPSTATVAIAAADSLDPALTFTWTDPKYSVGLEQSKFSIKVALTEDFAKVLTKEFTGVLTGSLLGNEINVMALKFGAAIGQPIALKVKVVASQANNNETKESAVFPVSVTPFADLNLDASTEAVVTTEENASAVGLKLDWNLGFLGYEGTRTYQLQYVESGSGFGSPKTINMNSARSKSFTQLELNNMASLEFGTLAGEVGNVDFRIKATNGAATIIYSNTVTVAITPYSSKPVPKYPVPANLFIVGDATPGGWSNPVPTPSQQLTRIDENTFGIILQLTGGKKYLLLPVNGLWDNKYNVTTSGANPAGDEFAPNAGSNDIPGPANDGLYKIIVDFITGTYTVTLLASNPIPANLFIVGDATPGSWTNPVPVPSQQFTQITNGEFQLTLQLTGGKHYLLLPVNGEWGKFNVATDTANPLEDTFAAEQPKDIPSPPNDGTYIINVNFFTMKYKVTQ
jgi:starch-binding outer membrane protein SusE/F